MIENAVHVALFLCMAPLLPGIITKVKAAFGGRRGPPVYQLYADLGKLLRKQMVTSRTTTWVFAAGPVAALAAAVLAGLLVPAVAAAPLRFTGDFLLLVGLLALGRFFTVAAALDTGSAFAGMGAAREATFACLAEPALLFGLLVLGRVSESLTLSGMLDAMPGAWVAAGPSLVLLVAGLLVIVLVETARIPFDDPATHLELTMIHEAMVLDHSGPALGMILYGAALRMFLLGALVIRIAVPVRTGSLPIDAAVFAAAMIALAVLIGVIESVMARLRLVNAANLLIASCLLCGFALLLSVRYAP